MKAIRVIPRVERNPFGQLAPVLFLPDTVDGDRIGCYARIGQHSTASVDYYRSTRAANLDDPQVKALLREYENLGEHTPLVILKRMPHRNQDQGA